MSAPHEAEFHLILDIFNMEGSTAWARAHQRPDDLLRQHVDHFANAGRRCPLGSVNSQKGLHHGHRNFVGLKRHDGPIATNDLVKGQQVDSATVSHRLTVGSWDSAGGESGMISSSKSVFL
jgi:hypothetical protein